MPPRIPSPEPRRSPLRHRRVPVLLPAGLRPLRRRTVPVLLPAEPHRASPLVPLQRGVRKPPPSLSPLSPPLALSPSRASPGPTHSPPRAFQPRPWPEPSRRPPLKFVGLDPSLVPMNTPAPSHHHRQLPPCSIPSSSCLPCLAEPRHRHRSAAPEALLFPGSPVGVQYMDECAAVR